MTSVDRPERMHERRADGEVVAAIDLGTNSFHLLVARVDRDGQYDVLAKEKEMVRLGSGADDTNTLTAEAMQRGIDALSRFRRIAAAFDATVVAIATSALREAANRETFLRRAQEEADVAIEIVPGVEEARLIHLGVLQSVPVFDQRIVVIDIGGGSTELLVGEGENVLLARSHRLGAIRLTERFFPEGVVRSRSLRECRTFIRSFLAPSFNDLAPLRPFHAVGSSGTIVNLARMVAARIGGDPLAVMNGTSFTVDALSDVVDDLVSRRTTEERVGIPGLDERRADIIVAGAVLLEQIVRGLDLDTVVVSEAAMREGIILDWSRPDTPNAFHHLSDIRRQSVQRMAEAFHEDAGHIGRATDLALELFDGLQPIHGLSVTERDYLEAAGLLHNVGLFISHSAHHKHSYYVIRNSDQLAGFTDREIEVIAQVARYHRKSSPKLGHSEYQRLRTHDQDLVRLLAGMLRVGIALDRTRKGVVTGLAVTSLGDPLAVQVRCADQADMSLEAYTALQRTSLLVESLGREVELQFVSETPVQ